MESENVDWLKVAHTNRTQGFIKCWKFFDQMCDHKL